MYFFVDWWYTYKLWEIPFKLTQLLKVETEHLILNTLYEVATNNKSRNYTLQMQHDVQKIQICNKI